MTHDKDHWINTMHEIGAQFAERAAGHDAQNTFVQENFASLKEKKVFSALVPADLGGSGVSHSLMCEMLRILASYCPSTALSLSMHQHLVAAAVWKHLHKKPGEKLLRTVAKKELFLVSTGARDWLESNGTMERVDGGYRVTAKKFFASGCPAGAMMITSAPYKDPEAGGQVLHFPVPFSAEGVSVDENWDAHGMRGTGSHTVILKDVFVPEEAIALTRPLGEYHPAWNVVLTVALPLITSVYAGVATTAAQKARDAAKRGPADQFAALNLGEMENQLTACQLAVDDMVRIANDYAFEPINDNANAMLVRKTLAVTAAIATAEKAMYAAGGPGFFRSFGIERLLRDARAGHYHPLPEKKQHMFTGRMALGLDPIG